MCRIFSRNRVKKERAAAQPRYTHVLFDADDTLLDFHSACRISLAGAVTALTGEERPELFEVYERNNVRWWLRYERGETTMPELAVGRFADFIADAKLEGFGLDAEAWRREYQSRLAACPVMVEGAQELCESLYGLCRMYIITNGIAEVQRGRMGLASIGRCFEELFISEEMGCRKPDSAFFDKVFERLGEVDRAKILVVGDSLSSDVAGGINAGLDVCWFNPNGLDAGELSPKYTVTRLAEVAAIVKGEGK